MEDTYKVAICFFGLCRTTNYTIKSIKYNIFNFFTKYNLEYDTYLHTYEINKDYNNSWSGEKNFKINNDNWKLLNPKEYLIEDEDEVIKKINISTYRTHGDPWAESSNDNTFKTLDNAILSLYSLYQVTQLWKNSNVKYNAIIYMRPDILYINKLQLSFFNKIKNNTVLLPNFEEYPVNDRFAIGDPISMKIYGERFLDAYDYSLKYPLLAERYLSDTLEKNKVNIVKIDFIFLRIRMNGTSPDFKYLNEYKYKYISNDNLILLYILIILVIIMLFIIQIVSNKNSK
jgi:hypothetical protein